MSQPEATAHLVYNSLMIDLFHFQPFIMLVSTFADYFCHLNYLLVKLHYLVYSLHSMEYLVMVPQVIYSLFFDYFTLMNLSHEVYLLSVIVVVLFIFQFIQLLVSHCPIW